MWVSYSSTRSTLSRYHVLRIFPRERGGGGRGGVLPFMGHIGMCGPEGFGFCPVLVINRIGIDFGHFGLK